MLNDDHQPIRCSLFLVKTITERNDLCDIILGDIVIVSDLNTSFINVTGYNGNNRDWEEIMPPEPPEMLFDPADGTEKPLVSFVNEYRDRFSKRAWLFDPWTGSKRDPDDIGVDPFGYTIVPPLDINTNGYVSIPIPKL